MIRRLRTLPLLLVLLPPSARAADAVYQKPPQEVLEVLHAAPLPDAFLDPAHRTILLGTPVRFPPIAEISQPFLKLAGTRVVVRNRALYGEPYWTSFERVTVADGTKGHVSLPAGAQAGAPQFSADGTHYVFSNTTPGAVELWAGDTTSTKVRRIENVKLNPFFGSAVQWMPDQKTLLVRLVPRGQGKAPALSTTPTGPDVKETSGDGKASSTYEVRDVLASAHDEENLEYYGATQLGLVDFASGKVTTIGKPGLYLEATPSPDGHLLVETIVRPFSRLTTYSRFPREVHVWDRGGNVVKHVASLPLAESIPIWGEPTGPREIQWRATAPATLYWVEAQDGGDWKTIVPQRDRVMTWKAPFDGQPAEVMRTQMRFGGFSWSDEPGLALVEDHDAIKHWTRTQLVDVDHAGVAPRTLWELSTDEKYQNPGTPVFKVLPNGGWVVDQEGDTIWLRGPGASPDGERPFLDRFDTKTLQAKRLFRSGKDEYQSPAAWLDRRKGEFLVRRETPNDPPNYFVRTLGEEQEAPAGEAVQASTQTRQVTHIVDPTPQLRAIKKKLVSYKRADGVDLSFTLYLPPGYQEGTRVPAVMNAYPLDYTDAKVAGQVAGSSQRFTTIARQHQLFFLLEGYAVIDAASLPCVGDANKIYDTYLEQLVAGAKAAVDKAVDMGVVDRDRIGVMGHSHGGLMTVNLLIHSDLFRAGVARSGAYNRSLTAFGFQSERRTLWEAPEVYAKVSPFFHADLLKLPLLLIHGEADVNPGTVPLQSELLYEAIRGNGGTARLVMLPYESHGYAAMESNEQVLYESIAWFEKYVKHAPPRPSRVPNSH